MSSLLQKYKDDYDADVIVYGHTHMPLVTENGTVINIGTFVEIATYVTEEDGVFTLHDLDI